MEESTINLFCQIEIYIKIIILLSKINLFHIIYKNILYIKMTKSFFDTMYNYIVSIDNDCCSKEDGDFSIGILKIFRFKIKRTLSSYLGLSN